MVLLVLIVVFGSVFWALTAELEMEFRDEGLGYFVYYPSQWIYERPSKFAVVFSGRAGTPAYHATVTIQNVASTKIGGVFDDVLSVVNDYKCQLVTGVEEICFYNQRTWSWRLNDGRELQGIGFTAEYPYEGTAFKTTQVIFPHANGNVFCSWAYTAPLEDYDTYRDIVDAMYDSWSFITNTSETSSKPGSSIQSSDIEILFEVQDHIYRLANSDSEFNLGKRDKKQYTIRVPAPGYLACILIDEPEQWIGVTVYNSAGQEVAGKVTTATSIYGGVYEVLSGSYIVEVIPGKFLDESDFKLYIVFSRSKFTEDDLISRFGSPNQVLSR
jgi:hypothetical protein